MNVAHTSDSVWSLWFPNKLPDKTGRSREIDPDAGNISDETFFINAGCRCVV